jgi:hypothetical protein
MEGMSSSGGLEIGISCFTEPHFGTGGQKHTHTSKEHGTSTKHRNSDIDLDWDKMFKDAFVTDVEVADLKNRIQIETPFAFGK